MPASRRPRVTRDLVAWFALCATLLAASLPAWAQTLPGSDEGKAVRGDKPLPRFLYVAAPAHEVPVGQAISAVHVNGPFDPQGRVLQTENPVTDFYTIDTSFLDKSPVEDPAHPGVFLHDRAVPPSAIVALSRVTTRGAYPAFDTAFNFDYAVHFGINQYPRVQYSGSVSSGQYQAAAAGAVGPKLILNRDMLQIHALATDPNELTVSLHGSDTLLSFSDENGHQTMISPRQLAAAIKQEIRNRGLPRNIPIRLLACESGLRQPGDLQGAAQQLAEAMVDPENPEGNTVIAPTGLTYHLALELTTGEVTEAVVHPTQVTMPIHANPEGESIPRWRTFRPTGHAGAVATAQPTPAEPGTPVPSGPYGPSSARAAARRGLRARVAPARSARVVTGSLLRRAGGLAGARAASPRVPSFARLRFGSSPRAR